MHFLFDYAGAIPHIPLMSNATKHNHDALPFGRKLAPGCCPRCDELRAGAPARKGWRNGRAQQDAARVAAVRAHDCKACGCGPCCTYGDF